MIFWEATFASGIICQDPDYDISELDNSKSKFYDVLEKLKLEPLESFVLYKDHTAFKLELGTGKFSIFDFDDIRTFRGRRPLYSFDVQASISPEKFEGPRELVFYTDVTKTMVIGSGEIQTTKRYRLGYKQGNEVRVIVI